ncbi:MAG: DUF952 domain-containing protein [Chloroflexi bacterium]|nr:DUF952 domain-containing protein [Chloroflexota bacterium]
MSLIVHIVSRHAWEAARAAGEYRADSLESQGFIHCSTPEQVTRVANAVYRGLADLALLVIETEKLAAPLKFEPPVHPASGQPETGSAELFPHLYGALNLDAVVWVVDFPPQPDGSFTLPDALYPPE